MEGMQSNWLSFVSRQGFQWWAGLDLVEFLAKGSHGVLQTSQADARTECHSWITDSEAPFPRTTFTQLVAHWQVELLPVWSLYPYVVVSLMWEGTLHITERETWISAQPQNPDLQSVLPARHAGAMVALNLWEWQTNVWFNLRPILLEGTHAWHVLDVQEL